MNIVALMYDFDKTLSPDFVQEVELFEKLGVTPDEFWQQNKEFLLKHKIDKMGYLYSILKLAREKNIPLTREFLHSCGKKVGFYDGVEDWFLRIDKFAKNLGITLEHYIISSGNTEILEGTKIAQHFKKIYACTYAFDDNGEAFWPGSLVDYTSKTQYMFRIKKRKLDPFAPDSDINSKSFSKKIIPYSQMIYIGDGETDIPCMKIIKDKGGTSLCIYEKNEKSKNNAAKIFRDGRVNHIALANYTEGSQIDRIIKETLINVANNLKK